MTDAWDPAIPSHKDLAHRIELGDGIPEMRPLSSVRSAICSVGFEIEHEEDLAARDDEVPWYYPLEGDLRKAQTTWDYFTVWRMSRTGKLVTHTVTWLAEKIGLAPKGTSSASGKSVPAHLRLAAAFCEVTLVTAHCGSYTLASESALDPLIGRS